MEAIIASIITGGMSLAFRDKKIMYSAIIEERN